MTNPKISSERLRELIERKMPPSLHGLHETANECMSCDLVFALRELVDRRAAVEPGDESCANCGNPHRSHTDIYDVCQGYAVNRTAES